ncbi:ModE molybdate transport repressor domain-containing protein [Pedobacter westerhofensis]|uniref:ModE molybdate transport repressor domain-containing protein n=2 Tax=Pedobacter westerhofensis TaxID=425512 RepID=A0A521FTZ2_9SPHI|nr:ModE molybdate transport repressor domain-containing protein [Pedobacter westerhofensis]
MINHMNTNFTAPVVISKRGGKGGGNAEVTQHGINAIARFYALKQKFSAFLEDINQSIVL